MKKDKNIINSQIYILPNKWICYVNHVGQKFFFKNTMTSQETTRIDKPSVLTRIAASVVTLWLSPLLKTGHVITLRNHG